MDSQLHLGLLWSSRRFLSTTSATTSSTSPPAPPSSGAARLTTRRLISIHGPDAPKFLQGIITSNVRPDSHAGFYAAFLTAPGKVLHDVFIYPTNGSKYHRDVLAKDGKDSVDAGYMIEVDADGASALMAHLKRHKLRSKFALRLLEEGELNVWSVWKENDRWTAHSQGALNHEGSLGLTDSRAPGMGQRVLIPPSPGSTLEYFGGLEEAPLSAYTIRRYLRGVPEGQTEIPRDESLPMNSNIDIMGGIDFKKGCYIGQELTIRTHHTGVVRRRILPVALYEPKDPAPDTLEYERVEPSVSTNGSVDIRRNDKRGRATGKLVSSIGNVGLAMCRLEQMSDLTISGEGSSFRPEDTFTLSGEGDASTGVKAFVPDWMRGRIREPRIQKRVG
ncbi:Aminomethyltransferase folate-binding domain-containing protein [Polychaeton citri CBS 116435]|uniref:Iron-sulfur cluster assembly factor IBA57 homolog, mitochondrial n=1 Tax=Polychaeton citri CBS 116435 TaxID=1314669 RepID=A0A9P4Q3X9_9PEZI|nr:Aminomethyltransferase folate-binding domain-containing protein [Polychaeton citri CBS 116435]